MRSETRPEHAALDAREGSGIGRSLEANQQRFMTSVAHELRTPITAIVGAAELLLTGGDENPMLTACDDEMSVVAGLEVGADDYIGLGRSDLLVIASDGCQLAVRTPDSESCSI